MVTFRRGAQESIFRIHTDSEVCTPNMVLKHGPEDGQQGQQRLTVVRDPVIPADRVKIPQRRIRRVVEAHPLSFGEEIRNQSIFHIIGKGSEDGSGFLMAPGTECETFQADHRIAAPIREPMVPRDNRARFISGGTRQRLLLQSRARGDNKLIGRHGQPTFDVFIRFASPLGQQFIQALGLCLKNGFGVEFEQFPRFRAGNKREGPILRKVRHKIAGAGEALDMLRASIAIDPVGHIDTQLVIRHELPSVGTQAQF